MKRFFLVLLTLIMCISLVLTGCGQALDSNKSEGSDVVDPAAPTDSDKSGSDKTGGDDPEAGPAEPEAPTGDDFKGGDGDMHIWDEGTGIRADVSVEASMAGESYGISSPGSATGDTSGKTVDSDVITEPVSEPMPKPAVEPTDPGIDPVEPGDPSDILIPDDPIVVEPTVAPTAGLLTAGEWNDNKNWDFFMNVLNKNEWFSYMEAWKLFPIHRVSVNVSADGSPLSGATVSLISEGDMVLWTAISDYEGNVYLFYDINQKETALAPDKITAELNGVSVSADLAQVGSDTVSLDLSGAAAPAKALDLMFVVDTTGSMGDELDYLKVELENVISQVASANANMPIRLSVNFYRDETDEYIVRPFEFTEDISAAVADLAQQYPDGGGDFEEAVEQALDNAVNQHTWSDDSVKLLFLVLDAPPHCTEQISSKLSTLMFEAASKGIRIIPVASSGVDTNTEFVLRTFASMTGGTYTFLTNDSGIGGEHLEPTIGDYEVEKLNDLIVRLVNQYCS